MRKSKLMSMLVTGMIFFVLGGNAWAQYDYLDLTEVQKWKGSNSLNIWTDVIGDINYFDTFGADLSGNKFTIYTNWNPGKDVNPWGVTTADLFIDNNSNGIFDYAIRLDTSGLGNVYNPITNKTSQAAMGVSGFSYGGLYDKSFPKVMPVLADGPNPVSTTSVLWSSTNPLGLNNHVDIDLSGLALASTWSFAWGTATCSNDAFAGQVQVPEPTTMLLLGLGLIGLAALRRKKMQ